MKKIKITDAIETLKDELSKKERSLMILEELRYIHPDMSIVGGNGCSYFQAISAIPKATDVEIFDIKDGVWCAWPYYRMNGSIIYAGEKEINLGSLDEPVPIRDWSNECSEFPAHIKEVIMKWYLEEFGSGLENIYT